MSLNKDKTNDKESYRYISFHEANVYRSTGYRSVNQVRILVFEKLIPRIRLRTVESVSKTKMILQQPGKMKMKTVLVLYG